MQLIASSRFAPLLAPVHSPPAATTPPPSVTSQQQHGASFDTHPLDLGPLAKAGDTIPYSPPADGVLSLVVAHERKPPTARDALPHGAVRGASSLLSAHAPRYIAHSSSG